MNEGSREIAGRRPLSTLQKIYYWANLIINPIVLLMLLLLFFGSDIPESLGFLAIGWVVVSALVNPKLWGCCLSVGASLGVAIIWLALFLLSAGSIAVIAAALIFFTFMIGAAGIFLIALFDIGLWVIALVAILQDR